MADPAYNRVEAARVLYAKLVAAGGGPLREVLERAFLAVPRERFLGRGPWDMATSAGYVATASDDPAFVYQDVVFALDRRKGINNGQPSLHAQLIGVLAPASGDCVLHVGCGTGYYTAILALLVTPGGSVLAYEQEPDLARRAIQCLAPWTNVEVQCRSGSGISLPAAEGVYVSAGATRPAATWLDALKLGGRLVFPLVDRRGFGVSLAVTRHDQGYAAKVVGRSAFIDCAGVNDPEEGDRVADAVCTGAVFETRSLRRWSEPDATAVLAGRGWWLSSRPLPAP